MDYDVDTTMVMIFMKIFQVLKNYTIVLNYKEFYLMKKLKPQ